MTKNTSAETYVMTIIEYDSQSKRVIVVPKEIDLLTLHWVFQAAYDWQYMHIFDYQIEPPETLQSEVLGIEADFEEDFFEQFTLKQYLDGRDSAAYIYDFGDWRQHDFTVEENSKNHPCWSCIEVNGPDQLEDHGGDGETPSTDEVTKRIAGFIKSVTDVADLA